MTELQKKLPIYLNPGSVICYKNKNLYVTFTFFRGQMKDEVMSLQNSILKIQFT